MLDEHANTLAAKIRGIKMVDSVKSETEPQNYDSQVGKEDPNGDDGYSYLDGLSKNALISEFEISYAESIENLQTMLACLTRLDKLPDTEDKVTELQNQVRQIGEILVK
ncbi:MAG: hypothetical protein AB2L11_13245 [Syntrophobacteraceae bacterium]